MAPEQDAIAAARAAYQRGRLTLALTHAAPALAYMVVALVAGSESHVAALGLAAFVIGALAIFAGGAFGRSVLPALVYGALPFTVTHVVQSFGHVCVAGGCVSWCMPACAATGLVVGVAFARRAERDRDPLVFFVAGFPLIVATGALGCRCLGYGSVVGLALGMLLVSLPSWPRWVSARTT